MTKGGTSPHGRSPLNRVWYAVLWCVCWAATKIWFRLEVVGRGNVPLRGPVVLVSNHQSHLDPVLIGVACPRPAGALARKTLFFWPLSWLIRSLGAVPVDLEGSALSGIKAILGMLHAGEAVIVFPEGTRTPDGRLQPLQPGFCAIVRRSESTVVPVAINGAYAALPRGAFFPRPRPITLTFGPTITPGEIHLTSDEQLSDRVRGWMNDCLADNCRRSTQPWLRRDLPQCGLSDHQIRRGVERL